MAATTVAVLFGGRSVEHEVSVITGHQVMDALSAAGHLVLPIYLTKNGEWYAGEPLHNLKLFTDPSQDATRVPGVQRVSLSPDRSVRQLLVHPQARQTFFRKAAPLWADIFFPTLHGSFGEDGALQGLFELADVPYVGSGVAASVIAMDKSLTKRVCRDAGIPVLDCLVISRERWKADPARAIADIERFCAYPLIVKPVNLGSSIGVKRCAHAPTVQEAIDTALLLDERVLIERAVSDFIEINCAVLGPPEQPSVCEQPLTSEAILSFDAKYKRGGKGAKRGGQHEEPGGMATLDRLIPAPIPEALTQQAQAYALQAFRAMGGAGTARVDFLFEKSASRLYLNEVNTLPGSMAFYLWEATGVPFDALVERLIAIALQRHSVRVQTQFSFEVNLLRGSAQPVSSASPTRP
jgi:D-alanine-D-alanine ligase